MREARQSLRQVHSLKWFNNVHCKAAALYSGLPTPKKLSLSLRLLFWWTHSICQAGILCRLALSREANRCAVTLLACVPGIESRTQSVHVKDPIGNKIRPGELRI